MLPAPMLACLYMDIVSRPILRICYPSAASCTLSQSPIPVYGEHYGALNKCWLHSIYQRGNDE